MHSGPQSHWSGIDVKMSPEIGCVAWRGQKASPFPFSAPPLLFPFPCQRLRFTSSTRIDRRFRLLVVVVVRSAALLRLEPICYHCVALQTKHKPALLSVDFTQSAHHMTPANGNRR